MCTVIRTDRVSLTLTTVKEQLNLILNTLDNTG